MIHFHRPKKLKLNNLGLVLGIVLKFYCSVGKCLKPKIIKFLGLIPTFEEVTGENLIGEPFWPTFILIKIKNSKIEKVKQASSKEQFICIKHEDASTSTADIHSLLGILNFCLDCRKLKLYIPACSKQVFLRKWNTIYLETLIIYMWLSKYFDQSVHKK